MKKIEVDGVPVLVARVDGEFFAYPPLCPHMAELLERATVRARLIDAENCRSWVTANAP